MIVGSTFFSTINVVVFILVNVHVTFPAFDRNYGRLQKEYPPAGDIGKKL